jgi:hypothetical protein
VPWKPSEPGEVPTLGYIVIDWVAEYLAAPDRGEYEPFLLYPEQEEFVLRFYELNPRTGRRRYRRGVISRPRGWGKSPLLAALACVEALAPVVPDGWDAAGQPVGKPWDRVRTPYVQIAAVSEEQTKNTWAPLLEMLIGGPACDEYPGLEPLGTMVNLPRGKIEPISSSARSVKGNKPIFAVMDQTEEWVPSNGGLHMFETMKNNAAKIGGFFVESPNAFTPGEGSVAENSAAFFAAIKEGRARDDGLYYDHREAPPTTEMGDEESLVAGLRVAYGDSSAHPDGCVLHDPPCSPGHVDLDVLVATIWDPTSDPQQSRSDFLNQVTHASDAWVTSPQWSSCSDPTKVVPDGDMIVLGFDGAIRDDSTALVACHVATGHLWIPETPAGVACWEKPDGRFVTDWEVDRVAVDAAVAACVDRYKVIGMYADPAHWQDTLDRWTSEFGPRFLVKATGPKPLEWWTNRPKNMVDALERFHDAVAGQQLTHDGGSVLKRHVLNARRRVVRQGIVIAKEHPHSPNKIDAAMAAVLAYECRSDAVAKGFARERKARRAAAF